MSRPCVPSRRGRELRKMAETEGLLVLSLNLTQGSHVRLVVKYPHYDPIPLVAPLTPSDHRGDVNLRAQMRRVARGQAA